MRMDEPIRLDEEAVQRTPCPYCGKKELRVQYRTKFFTGDVLSFSLAGVNPKFSVSSVGWPWIVCNHCGDEAEGQIVEREGGR